MYEGEMMPSMFSTRDPEEHKHLKKSVSQKFSMTSIRTLEYLVDPCSKIFTDAMMDMQGQVVDLGVWVQWYAFDVIGAMSFSKRFGFMENRKDMNGVIAGIETLLRAGGIVGQVPWLTEHIFGNLRVRNILVKLSGPAGDPVAIATKVLCRSLAQNRGLLVYETDIGNRWLKIAYKNTMWKRHARTTGPTFLPTFSSSMSDQRMI
mgnify:CR=1 FL=1|jgi:hypothetical protein|tara:strand:- start:13806 stop:14420 length:615 start_codon:yes stop_codon:yes gene_type:complete